MLPTEPQFIYLMLIMPSLFGLTLIGEGLSKVVHEEWAGLISITCGILFVVAVVFAYFFFSPLMA